MGTSIYTTIRLTKDLVKQLKIKSINEDRTIEDIITELLSK